MSKVIIAIVAMFALMIFPGAGFWNLLSNVVGGGVAEEEIQSLKEKIDDLSNK